MLPQALPRQLSQLQAPAICFLLAFKAAVCLPSNASNPSASIAKATLRATGPSHLLSRAFKLTVFPALKCFHKPCQGNSPSYRPQPSVFKSVQACHLPALKCFRTPCQSNSPSYRPQPSVFKGVQACRLPAFKCFRRPQPSVSFNLRSRLPFACLQMLQNPSTSVAKATLRATGPSHLFLKSLTPAVCPPSNASAGLAKATLPATGPSHLFLMCSSLPLARLQVPQTLPQALPRQLSQLQSPAICF